MLGFMGVTAFLSMWISNTATTAMMVPIVLAVLEQLNGTHDPDRTPGPPGAGGEEPALPPKEKSGSAPSLPAAPVSSDHGEASS